MIRRLNKRREDGHGLPAKEEGHVFRLSGRYFRADGFLFKKKKFSPTRGANVQVHLIHNLVAVSDANLFGSETSGSIIFRVTILLRRASNDKILGRKLRMRRIGCGYQRPSMAINGGRLIR